MPVIQIVKSLGLKGEARQKAEALIRLAKQVEGLDFPISLEPPILPTLKLSHFSYYEEGKLLGLAGLQEYGEIEPYILVHPNSRGRGIGRALLAEIEAEGRRYGHDHLLLLCDQA